MKILAMASARSIWLMPTVYLNPYGRNAMPVIAELTERYSFAKSPMAAQYMTRPLELKFEGGTFQGADGTPLFVNLSIHDDGVVGETRHSTEESDRFLDDVLRWFTVRCELPDYSAIEIQKIYASELIVEFSRSFTLFNTRMTGFMKRMQRGMSNNPGKSLELSALQFGPDPAETKNVVPFKIERIANTPHDKNQYHCAAPVPTAEHVDLLTILDEAIAGS